MRHYASAALLASSTFRVAAVLAATVLAGLMVPASGAEMTGKDVFAHYCAACHGSDDGPGTMQLRRTRGKNQALLTQRIDLKAPYVEYVVRHGLKAMPPFTPSDLTDEKLKALAAFLAK